MGAELVKRKGLEYQKAKRIFEVPKSFGSGWQYCLNLGKLISKPQIFGVFPIYVSWMMMNPTFQKKEMTFHFFVIIRKGRLEEPVCEHALEVSNFLRLYDRSIGLPIDSLRILGFLPLR